jgi:hypothetical protein
MKCSVEQQVILDNVKLGKNVKINAVFGSGKTTTALMIAKNNPDRKILLITYNARLKDDTRTRIKKYGITNVEIHNYHSFCIKYLGVQAYTDLPIIRYFENDQYILKINLDFDMLILDEAQDIKPIYYKVIHLILNYITPQIIVMGDVCQSLYEYSGSDSRYLSMADRIYDNMYDTNNSKDWVNCELTTSYRLTNQQNSFFKCITGMPHINTIKDGAKVSYYVVDLYGDMMYNQVVKWIDAGVPLDQIYILQRSLKSKRQTPTNTLVNKLSNAGYPVYVPNNDDEVLRDQNILGKIVFATFHQTKGCEREAVLITGFDSSYYEYGGDKISKTHIPNALAVALSRSLNHLAIFQSQDKDHLNYIDSSSLLRLYKSGQIDLRICSMGLFVNRVDLTSKINYNIPNIDITQMLDHLPVELLKLCLDEIDIKCESICTNTRNNKNIINISGVSKQKYGDKTLSESVSDFNGLAIPAMFEYLRTGKISIFDYLETDCWSAFLSPEVDSRTSLHNPLLNIVFGRAIIDDDLIRTDISYIYNKIITWNYLKNGYKHRRNQISEINWIDMETFMSGVNRLDDFFKNNRDIQFEYPITYMKNGKQYNGFIDILVDENTIYEIKTTSSIRDEYFLQVVLYGYLYSHSIDSHNNNNINTVYLFDVLNGNKYTISGKKPDSFSNIFKYLERKEEFYTELNNLSFVTSLTTICEDIVNRINL